MNSSKVPFTAANVSKCICPKCPVQAKSKCVSDQLKTIKEAMSKNQLMHEDIPGVYCAAGKATCQDIDLNQSCICGKCTIYADYKLASGKPAYKFCQEGMAK